MQRSSGIIMHISSLPSPYGIGTLGKEAFEFVDFLVASGQKHWQMLPLGPTGYGDSPYQSFSSFAGNPYLIDLDKLVEQGLLTEEEVSSVDWGNDPRRVDYGKLYFGRFPLFERAFARFENDKALDEFTRRKKWLPDYALFMALKDHFGGCSWVEWPDEALRLREPKALARSAKQLANRVRFHRFLQFLFFEQWQELRDYATGRGVGIIGDLPIYVPLDSADVWANPGAFLLDEDKKPTLVAGVPPDYFNADGQLWGNPVYDWVRLQQTGYAWWMERVAAAAECFDVIRLDHFRGFCDYWTVLYGAKTAREGAWKTGPGKGFVDALKAAFPDLPIIAEDLGFLTAEVHALRDYSGFMGMKVLQFAFDSREPSDYLPHNFPRNCVCYTGTHDNTTALGWAKECGDLEYAARYLGLSQQEGYHWGLIRGGMSSVADLFAAQMQDYLGLGDEARMNTPGEAEGNWQFRMAPGACTPELAEKIAGMTRMFGR